MRIVICLAATLAAAPPPAREFRIDKSHTDVSFAIGFLGHPVRGRFDDVSGTISYADKAPAASGVTIVIATKSISTGSAHRDEHLRSPDFFDAPKYPVIVFHSTSVAERKDSLYATGMLSMHGVTRTVTIPFRETHPPLADPHGSTLLFFTGGLRIVRKDFGILGGSKYNDWFDELRSKTMSDSVDIALEVAGWANDAVRSGQYATQLQRISERGIDASLTRLATIGVDTLKGAIGELDGVAQALEEQGKGDLAIRVLETAIKRLDTEAAAHAALARAYELSGRRDLAAAHTTRALALDSLDTRAWELARRLGMDTRR